MMRVYLSILVVLCAVGGLYASTAPTKQPETKPAWAAKAPPGAKITKDGWFAPQPKVTKPPLPEQIERAFVVPIREPITPKTYKAIERKVKACREGKAQIVILDMDTWGGDALAALDITRFIKTELSDIYTVCYARTRAISAGAMIAMACDEIIMTDVGKLGDCAPISPGGQIEGVRREKIETVLRVEFEESAQRNGYNVALATSMVSHDQEVWLVRNIDTHELRYVLKSEYDNKVIASPDSDDEDAKKADKKVKKSKNRKWELVEIVLPENKLLTMTPKKAQQYGFVKNIIDANPDKPLAGLEKHFNITAPPTALVDSWSENMVDFLTSPVVAGLLVFMMLLFGYTEMHTPGFGIFGGIAILCLVTLLCSQFLVGMAQWWEIAAFVLGVVLILLEIFVIPGFGVAGISGIILCVLAGLAMLIPNMPDELPIPEGEWAWDMFTSGLMATCLGFIAFMIAAAFLSRYLPQTSLIQNSKLVLKSVQVASETPAPESSPVRNIKPGDEGKTLCTLRPVGEVQFGDAILDAMSQGGMIDAGKKVRVLDCKGNRIVVEEVEEA